MVTSCYKDHKLIGDITVVTKYIIVYGSEPLTWKSDSKIQFPPQVIVLL